MHDARSDSPLVDCTDTTPPLAERHSPADESRTAALARRWVSFRDTVYCVGDFIDAHPGGRANLLQATGGAVDAMWSHWSLHHQGYNGSEPVAYAALRSLPVVGTLVRDSPPAEPEDAYREEPHRPLCPVKLRPLNGETGSETEGPFEGESVHHLLPHAFLTPNDAFYVRNHAPVPPNEGAAETLLAFTDDRGATASFSVMELMDGRHGDALPVVSLPVTLQCTGNRLGEVESAMPTQPNRWSGRTCGAGLISNASWVGVRFSDFLALARVDASALEGWHVEFTGADGYMLSLPLALVADPRREVLLAFGMNGEPLPRDHGAPLRLLVPGVVGARSCKWLSSVELRPEPSESCWQRRWYTRADGSPILEWGVQGLITSHTEGDEVDWPDDRALSVHGVAYSGGGRRVVRVEVSADSGASWVDAALVDAAEADARWAWTRWKAELAPPSGEDQPVLCCRATDSEGNVQPANGRAAVAREPTGYLFNAVHRVAVKRTRRE